MTVQELFKQVGFGAIITALCNTHRNDKSIESTAMYKQAFDKLVRLGFSGNGGVVTFEVTPREHWFDESSLPLVANGVEGDLWEDIVGKEVTKPADNPFTDAELAGAILWGATFYGFTDHYRWDPFNRTYSKYGEQAKVLERKLYVPYIRSKETISSLKTDELHFGVAFTREVWEEIEYHQRHQNRQKRKRFYRIKNRITQLKHLDKRTHKISEVERRTGHPLGSLAEKMLNAASICENWRECYPCAGENRVDYAIDLMSNYFPTASDILSTGEEVIIIFYTSPENLLTVEETTRLKEYLNALTDTSALHFLEGSNPDITSELDIEFISISETVIPDDDKD